MTGKLPLERKSGYIPTLDGWRALAILIVLLDHSPSFGAGHLSTARFHDLGDFGVEIFFALSGLLITTRLLDEEQRTGGLHLKGFYLRRLMRIQPVALLYLGVVAVLTWMHRLPANWRAFAAALFLVRNLVCQHRLPSEWPTGHFWSLAVEEQFYLLLPATLLLVRRRRATLLLGAALLDMAWYVYVCSAHHWAAGVYHFRTDLCFHFLLLAAAIAVLMRGPKARRLFARCVHAWWVVPATLLMLPIHSPVRTLLFLTPTLLVMSTVLHPQGWLGKLLELAPLRYLGRISYSLYIWQSLYLSGFFAPTLHTFGNMQRLWLVWPASLATAIASYHFFEKPLIRLGHRLARPVTAGHADLAMKGLQPVPTPIEMSASSAVSPQTAPATSPSIPEKRKGFYRPELDMLRLFAFLSVFCVHGIAVNAKSGAYAGLGAGLTAGLRAFAFVVTIGGYGLPLFFFLSSFLITTLLVLERQRTGAVHIRSFYARRILRIWPLYLAFLLACFVVGHFWGAAHFTGWMLTAYLFVSANWYMIAVGAPTGAIGPLWSISVEEQFYLIWPALVRKLSIAGMEKLCAGLFVLSLVATGILSAVHDTLFQVWLNSGAQMIFFAGGALLAIRVGLQEQRKGAGRALAGMAAGIALWLLALSIGHVTATEGLMPAARAVPHYLLMCLGCAALLMGFLAMPETWIRPKLVYFGRISYGLYVFHGVCLVFGREFLAPHLRGGVWVLVTLAMTVALAVPSYEFYEKPFLKLKRRFEFVHSRPVADAAIAPQTPLEANGPAAATRRDAVISVPRPGRVTGPGLEAPVTQPHTQGPVREERPALEIPRRR